MKKGQVIKKVKYPTKRYKFHITKALTSYLNFNN